MTKEYKEVVTKAVVTTDDDDTFGEGTEVTVVEVDKGCGDLTYYFTDGDDESWMFDYEFEWVEDTPEIIVDTSTTTSDGAATSYYDIPYKDWVTGNDLIEYLGENVWGRYATNMKDVQKVCFRLGQKDGTSVEYDARKLIYSGCRILRMIGGVDEVRKTLQGLLDDPQFQGTLDTKDLDEPSPAIDPVPTLESMAEEIPTHKFKVGDKVYISESTGVVRQSTGVVHHRYLSKVGVVTELWGLFDGQPRYDVDFSGVSQVCFEDDDGLILVEDVTYDFESMLRDSYYDMSRADLVSKFSWANTPQGFSFWNSVDDGEIEGLEWVPILVDMEQQYEEWKRTLKVATQ